MVVDPGCWAKAFTKSPTQRHLWHVIATVMVIIALGALSIRGTMPRVMVQSTAVTALVPQTGFSAALHEGDCADLGALTAPITHASVPSGPPVGNPDAQPVASSFTSVPLPLERLRASHHVIVVADSAVSGAIACGEIAGFLTEDGSLVFGLTSVRSSDVHGIAVLTPRSDGGSTGVSLFVTVPGDY